MLAQYVLTMVKIAKTTEQNTFQIIQVYFIIHITVVKLHLGILVICKIANNYPITLVLKNRKVAHSLTT